MQGEIMSLQPYAAAQEPFLLVGRTRRGTLEHELSGK